MSDIQNMLAKSNNGRIDIYHHILPEEYVAKLKGIGITTAIGREFPDWSPEKSLDFMKKNGISKAITSISTSVLGERVWQDRDKVAVPDHHNKMPHILNGITSIGMLLSIWAIVMLSIWPAVLGIALVIIGKSWYLDRMVWLYRDMKHLPEYGKWLY